MMGPILIFILLLRLTRIQSTTRTQFHGGKKLGGENVVHENSAFEKQRRRGGSSLFSLDKT